MVLYKELSVNPNPQKTAAFGEWYGKTLHCYAAIFSTLGKTETEKML